MSAITTFKTNCHHTHHLFSQPLCKSQPLLQRIANIVFHVLSLGIPLGIYHIYSCCFVRKAQDGEKVNLQKSAVDSVNTHDAAYLKNKAKKEMQEQILNACIQNDVECNKEIERCKLLDQGREDEIIQSSGASCNKAVMEIWANYCQKLEELGETANEEELSKAVNSALQTLYSNLEKKSLSVEEKELLVKIKNDLSLVKKDIKKAVQDIVSKHSDSILEYRSNDAFRKFHICLIQYELLGVQVKYLGARGFTDEAIKEIVEEATTEVIKDFPHAVEVLSKVEV